MPSYKTSDVAKPRQTRSALALRLMSLTALTALLLAGMISSIGETEASWSNSEYARGNDIEAGTVRPPSNLECEAPAIGRPTLEWEHPSDGPPEGGYVLEVEHNVTGNTNRYVIEDAETTSLRLSDGLLRTLLGNLLGLGGNFTARIQAVGPEGSEWVSTYSNETEFYPGLLGIILPRCS